MDAQHKVLQAAGLSPLAKKAGVLGPRWERDVEFCQVLFLTIVRSEQKAERMGLLHETAQSRVATRKFGHDGFDSNRVNQRDGTAQGIEMCGFEAS